MYTKNSRSKTNATGIDVLAWEEIRPMRKARVLYAIFIVAMVITCCVGISQKHHTSTGQLASTGSTTVSKEIATISLLNDMRLVAFSRWLTEGDGGTNISYVVRAFDEDQNHESSGVKLSIFTDSGSLIFEEDFSSVYRISPIDLLRTGSPQLVMEVNYGGNENCLEVLDYKDGKIFDLTHAIKPNNCFSADAEVRPQFRRGVQPAIEPFQIFLTNPGLAGTDKKYTDVYRYKDREYVYVGRFSPQDVDDFIEGQIKEGVLNKEKVNKTTSAKSNK